jgi:DNA-binding transcriptional ArsR family regulator
MIWPASLLNKADMGDLAAAAYRPIASVECTGVYMYYGNYMNAFEMLADPTRRQIVATLRGGEHQVNDIVAATAIHQSGVSRHLRLLKAAGFVQVRPAGQLRMYSLRPEPFRELGTWLADYQRLWDARLSRFAAALEKKQAADRRPRRKGKAGEHHE